HMADFKLQSFLVQLIWHIPTLLILTGGLLIALIKFASHPLPSILTLIGCGSMLLGRLCGMSLNYVAVYQEAGPDRNTLLQLFGICNTALSAIGLAFLVAAVFVGRTGSSPMGERDF